MSTTTQEAVAAEHPVVMVAVAALLGGLLGIGGIAMVSDTDPERADHPAAAQQP